MEELTIQTSNNSAELQEKSSSRSRLSQYGSAKVMVYYNSPSGYTDTGLITYLDDHWVELTKDSGERLLIPTTAVRILKLLEVHSNSDDAATLLRPVE